MKSKKTITVFDVLNEMPIDSVLCSQHAVGGRQLGKKHNNNAVIEMLVDNDTFQDFAFQKTYGESKSNKSKKYFLLYVVDADEYEKSHQKLKAKQTQ